jgi:hypothetical protein
VRLAALVRLLGEPSALISVLLLVSTVHARLVADFSQEHSDCAAAAQVPPAQARQNWFLQAKRCVGIVVLLLRCRRPPYDVALERGELLESEYIVAAGAAIMLDAVPRAPPPTQQTVAAVSKASQVYQRMGPSAAQY